MLDVLTLPVAALKLGRLSRLGQLGEAFGELGGVMRNPGIRWSARPNALGAALGAQGAPWEAFLEGTSSLGRNLNEIKRNFRTFDFFDQATGVATSAKTLNLSAESYQTASAVERRVRAMIDETLTFPGDGRELPSRTHNTDPE